MLNLITRILALAERIFDWLEGYKKQRRAADIRKAVAEHDAEALNRLIQERRDNDD